VGGCDAAAASRDDRPMSENTLNGALRRLGFRQDEMTAHGFRAAASSILNESGLWNPDTIEAQLAHVEQNAVRRAYVRAAFWDERVRMMEWWADRCSIMAFGAAVGSASDAGGNVELRRSTQ
jgi:integrase